MFDLEKYMIPAEEGLFSRAKEKKAQREKEAAERKAAFEKIVNEIGPKIKPILLATQNQMFEILQKSIGKYSGVRISKREIDPSEFMDGYSYFCNVDINSDMESIEFNKFVDIVADVDDKLKRLAENCGKKCVAIMNKNPDTKNASYEVDYNSDDYCAINLALDWY